MAGAAAAFVVGWVTFCVWLLITKWSLLAPAEVAVLLLQAGLPLALLAVCSIGLVRPAQSVRRSIVGVVVVLILSYPLWIGGWWLASELAIASIRIGADPDFLNNSQAFIARIVELPQLSIGVAAVIALARLAMSLRT